MARKARRSVGGLIYHVLNRANSRRRLFLTDKDYLAFFRVLLEARDRWPAVQVLALCAMPNHWHLVVRPSGDGELSNFMRWLTQTHTQRWRHAKRTVGYGALYQGRFKSFVVQEDRHLLVLCRYVERNPLRAKLVKRAEEWRWSSAWIRASADTGLCALLTDDWPVDRPGNWQTLLNEPQIEKDEERVRLSVQRNRPLGDTGWVEKTSAKLKLEHTLRPAGRPRKEKE